MCDAARGKCAGNRPAPVTGVEVDPRNELRTLVTGQRAKPTALEPVKVSRTSAEPTLASDHGTCYHRSLGKNEQAALWKNEPTTDKAPGSVVGDEFVGTPNVDSIQRDVAEANRYRLELIKTTMALATGLFAFTVAFPAAREKSLPIVYPWLPHAAWIAIGISICAGLYHMRMWERFYMSYQERDWKEMRGDLSPRTRELVDLSLPVRNYKNIYFAAAELNGSGVRFYGDYCLVLKPRKADLET